MHVLHTIPLNLMLSTGIHRQEAPRAPEGASHTATDLSNSIKSPTNGNEDPAFPNGSNDDLVWMALSDGRTFPPNNSEITKLADNGATEHNVNDEPIPDLEEEVLNYTVLHTPKNVKNSRPANTCRHRHLQ